ncbi:MAG: hypothetical protein K8S62_01815 [Candidatus Sabulitectum sp.]|nr:hypothetical protein [Candidatus Sabulitectum sp.]
MEVALQTFDQFKKDLTEILGENLFEIIIHGSYVLGDFRPGFGDLDYIAVSNDNLDDATNSSLFKLVDQYRSSRKLLLHQLEGTFYPKRFLHELSLPFTGCYIGTGRKGWRTIITFQNSLMDLRLINQHGISLLGKNLQIYNPDNSEIMREQITDIKAFIHPARTVKNAGTGMWMTIIHWCSRTIFYHVNSRIASKTEACSWCAEQPELKAFREVFKNAEGRRYPFGEAAATDEVKTACIALLSYTESFLTGTLKMK